MPDNLTSDDWFAIRCACEETLSNSIALRVAGEQREKILAFVQEQHHRALIREHTTLIEEQQEKMQFASYQ